jgi:nuclear pore complex protein Nup93
LSHTLTSCPAATLHCCPAHACFAAYTLAALQAELNRWGPKYYSKDGKEPLLFLTVLLLSLQFKRGLAFLLKSDMAKAYRLDGIHLAIALHCTGVSGD